MQSWEKCNRFIDAMGLITDPKHVRHSLGKLTESLGFRWYAYIHLQPQSERILSNYPAQWQERYRRNSYQMVDPVIETVKRKKLPFVWSLDKYRFFRAKQVGFVREAHEFGIRSGLTIPLPAGFGHMAMLTFASDQSNVKDQLDHLPAITVASFIHAFMTLRGPLQCSVRAVQLTTQEATCLRWAAEGKTMQETAKLLGIKNTSARSYLDSARAKLSAVNLIQAAATATRLRLI